MGDARDIPTTIERAPYPHAREIMATENEETVTVPHVERILGHVSAEWVLISCDCPIGEDHSYAEWIARFGARDQ